MNVLSMGLPFGTPGEPVQQFRSRCGHEVRVLAIEGACDWPFDAQDTAAAIVARMASKWTPDLFVCWCPEVVPPPLAIEACPVKTVAVVSDWTVYFPQLEYNLSRYDIVLTDRLGAQTLRLPGSQPYYLGPLYSQRTGVHRPLGLERDIDIAFAGNLNHATHSERGRLLEQVAALNGRFRVVIASDLPPEEYTALFNRARIVFNYGLRHEMNLRCFEALACGAALFVEEENLEVAEVLRDREAVVLYQPENLTRLLEECLERPGEAARIGANGLARAETLAGENRLDALLEGIAGLPLSGRPFNTLPREERAMAEVLQYASSPCPAQRTRADQVLSQAVARYPEEPAFRLAQACAQLQKLADGPVDDRETRIQDLLGGLQAVASQHQQAAVPWLNLAFVSRRAQVPGAEERCLDLALQAASPDWGGLLLGERRDPYYARWREGMAYGTASVQLLWAAAAARLAMLLFDRRDTAGARELAQRSIRWRPDVPDPYRTLARAAEAEGSLEEAAATLEEGLALTAFDSEYREQLIGVYRQLGRPDKAQQLAAQSARIFGAWWAAAPVAERFRETAQELAPGV